MSTVRAMMRGVRWRALEGGITSARHAGAGRSPGLGSRTKISSFKSVHLSRRSFGSSPVRFAGKSEEAPEAKEDLGNLEDVEDSSASKASGKDLRAFLCDLVELMGSRIRVLRR
mmetsp:Transcript_15282/g.62382  ORF Transcript_15282/g.62382 Transcript_15282/m.62382 type:complete len:114 (-) Transcript_15282:929-1270(-)